ncbi:hypothetical protein M422DRAFT_40404 [Sphaerobolus stellatus SS14]|nr:hypothetical protein M422DRAFT_40404 [Sphaerobolus stellatus SS14]
MAALAHADSFIADSTVSPSSPEAVPSDAPQHPDASDTVSTDDHAPKRVVRTYGKPKAATETAENPITDTSTRILTFRTAPPNTETQVIPDSEDSSTSSPKFDYSWRAQLKAIDDGADIKDVLGTTLVEDVEVTSKYSPNTLRKSLFEGSLSSLTSEPPSMLSSQPLEASQINQHRRAQTKGKGNDSAASDSDSPQKSVSKFNSPFERSFDTPPTSPMEQLVVENAKGSETESQSPMPEDTQVHHDAKGKASASKDKRPKACKLTKKELAEMQKESARLLANQHVTVQRAQTRQVYTVQSLFSKLKTDPITPKQEPSDPIAPFSSPSTTNIQETSRISVRQRAPSIRPNSVKIRKQTPSSPTSVHVEEPNFDADGDEDEEMPDTDTLLRINEANRLKRLEEEKARAEAEKKAKELQDKKRKALEHSKLQATESDTDDDLEVEGIVGHQRQSGNPFALRRQGPSKSTRNLPAPRKSTTLTETSLELAAKPTFLSDKAGVGRNPPKSLVTPHTLNEMLLQRADKQSGDIEEKKKKEWVRAGGVLKEQDASAEETVQDWVEKGSMRQGDTAHGEESDENDSDYEPGNEADGEENANEDDVAEMEDSGIPGDNNEEGDDNDSMTDQMDVSDEDADKENLPVTKRRVSHAVLHSDDEDEDVTPQNPAVLVPNSSFITGSADSPSNDKENSAELAFSTSDDKENEPVPRHRARGRIFGEPFEEDISQGSSNRGLIKERTPLRRLDSDSELPTLSLSHVNPDRVLRVLLEEDKESTLGPVSPSRNDSASHVSSTSTSPRNLGTSAFLSPPPVVQPGEDIAEDNAPMSILGKRGFSQIFFDEKSPSKEKAKPTFQLGHTLLQPPKGGEFEFTQPNSLLPSVKISATQRREVDEMFGKDQEFKIEEARRQKTESAAGSSAQKEPYFGSFVLSQTPQLSSRSLREPLETLSFDLKNATESDEESQPRLRRLVRGRSPVSRNSSPATSPKPTVRNAFDALRNGALARNKADKPSKKQGPAPIFIEEEAQESDDELLPGFGDVKTGDDEEAGDDDPDGVLEGLVDDSAVDVNEDKVLEKHLEHKAADDVVIEKLHRDAIEGKLRAKRRGAEFFSDSDSDDETRRPRKHFLKKRRIEGDTLDACEQNPETRPFFDAYMKPLDDDEDVILGFLNEPSQETEANEDDSSDEPMEVISAAEIARQVREVAEREDEDDVGEVSTSRHDVGDVSWLDDDDEDDDMLGGDIEIEAGLLRRVGTGSNMQAGTSLGPAYQIKRSSTVDNTRLTSWAKQESQSRSAAAGRGGGFAPKEIAGRTTKKHIGQSSIKATGKAEGSGTQSAVKRSASSLISTVEKRKGFDT